MFHNNWKLKFWKEKGIKERKFLFAVHEKNGGAKPFRIWETSILYFAEISSLGISLIPLGKFLVLFFSICSYFRSFPHSTFFRLCTHPVKPSSFSKLALTCNKKEGKFYPQKKYLFFDIFPYLKIYCNLAKLH